MNHIVSRNALLTIAMLTAASTSTKRPKKEKPPKEPKPALSQEQRQVIVANVAQVMGSICTIAQDPHNPLNIGNSIGSIIQALINIIIEKLAHRSINFNNEHITEESLNELYLDINKEITEIMISKSFMHQR